VPHDLNTIQTHVIADNIISSAKLVQPHKISYHIWSIAIECHLNSRCNMQRDDFLDSAHHLWQVLMRHMLLQMPLKNLVDT